VACGKLEPKGVFLLKLKASFFSFALSGVLLGYLPLSSSIVVDKSSHTLTYYTFHIPVRTFSVAVGRSDAETPVGTFPIVMLAKNPWYLKLNIPGGDPKNPLGTRWIGLEVPGTDGSKYGIHGTNRPESIGESLSDGCIRMRNTDVNWLYRYVGVGTWVTIIE
jgi:lipoprotein-anchoring transpeptidase ErfK/SrfK